MRQKLIFRKIIQEFRDKLKEEYRCVLWSLKTEDVHKKISLKGFTDYNIIIFSRVDHIMIPYYTIITTLDRNVKIMRERL